MTTQDYAASVQGVAIRITQLTSTGALSTVAGDSQVVPGFSRVSFTPEYEAGDEITEKAADGTVCVTYQAPDTLKRVNFEIAICEPDPEITALLSGGILLAQGATPATMSSVGWASSKVGEDPTGNGVAIEVWSRAVQGGKAAAVRPYFHWVFPYVKTRLSGDRVIENGLLATTFEGFGLGNSLFDEGPDGRWNHAAVTDRPYMYSRSDYAPIGLKGPYTWNVSTGAGTAVTAFTDVAGLTDGISGYDDTP